MQWEQDPFSGFERFELPNGLEVHSKTYEGCPFESVGFIVYAGSFYDEVGKEGTAHFLEHLPASSVPGMDFADLMSFFASYGGGAKFGTTSTQATTWSFFFPTGAEINKAFQIFGSMLFDLRHSEEAIEHERRVILQEMTTRLVPFRRRRIERRNSLLYPSHRLGQLVDNVIGTTESVSSITASDLTRFYESYYVPKNTAIVAVGGLTTSQLEKTLLETGFNATRAGERVPKPYDYAGPLEVVPHVERFRFSEEAGLEVEFGSYGSCGLVPTFVPVEYVAMVVEGLNELLFSRIREKYATAYGFDSGRERYPGHTMLYLNGKTEPSFLERSAELVEDCLDELFSTPAFFLKKCQEQVQDMRLTDKSKTAIRKTAMSHLIAERRIISYSEGIDLINAMTFDEFRKIASFLEKKRRFTELVFP